MLLRSSLMVVSEYVCCFYVRESSDGEEEVRKRKSENDSQREWQKKQEYSHITQNPSGIL